MHKSVGREGEFSQEMFKVESFESKTEWVSTCHSSSQLRSRCVFLSPGEVLGGLDGRLHALHGEEGRQVGRVGTDHDQGKEPPQRRDHPRREGSGK